MIDNLDEERYIHVLKDIEEMKSRLDSFEKDQTSLSKRLLGVDFGELVETLKEINGLVRGDRRRGTPGLKSIVYGSEELGVKPLRTEMEELRERQDEVLIIYGRVRWLLGILGITGLGGAAYLVIILRQLLGI